MAYVDEVPVFRGSRERVAIALRHLADLVAPRHPWHPRRALSRGRVIGTGSMGRVTLQVADHVGVSRMTVSNAFSRPDQLSPSLRERILSVANELGYVGPDPTARAQASGAAGTVGLLLSDTPRYALTDEVAMAFLAAVAAELGPSGLALTLLSAAPQGDIAPARDVAFDGALVYSCNPDSTAVGGCFDVDSPGVRGSSPRPGHSERQHR